MALIWWTGFDFEAASNLVQEWGQIINSGNCSLGTPGRLGYGNYLITNAGNAYAGPLVGLKGAPYTTLICGAACYVSENTLSNGDGFFAFQDNLGANLCTVVYTASGQIGLQVAGGSLIALSATGLVVAKTWFYLESEITFSNSGTGSVTLRINGATVSSVASVTTAANGNGCSIFGVGTVPIGRSNNDAHFIDDLYVLSTSAPNNAFFGDIKILPLYPAGNGRVDGFSRFGGTSSGNWTAVNEVPPDGDTSYVYSATPGTEDCYTLTTLSNVATIKAVGLKGYVRKDDTPSRVVALGVGNGSTENFDAGTSVNTTYTYINRALDTNPLTSAAWAVADFTTLQLAVELIS